MGSGKTRVGQRVANRSGFPFVDVDAEIVERAGVTIPEIFEEQGEPAFRHLESEEIARISGDGQWMVVATGGGAILREENRRLMRESGLVVWLKPSLSALIAAGKTRNRPLLQGYADLGARYTEIWKARVNLYEQAAHLTLDADGKSRDLIGEEVWRIWKAS